MNDAAQQPPVTEAATESGRTRHTPGTRLRQLREDKGLSQSQVAESLHLTVHYVKALETDEYHKLPGRIFVKGYFKTYAQLMDADVDSILQNFEDLCELREDYKADSANSQRRRSHVGSKLWIVMAALIIAGAIFLSWWFWGRDTGMQTAMQSSVPDYLSAAEAASRQDPDIIPAVTRPITAQNEDTADAVMLKGDVRSVETGKELPEAMVESVTDRSRAALPLPKWAEQARVGG